MGRMEKGMEKGMEVFGRRKKEEERVGLRPFMRIFSRCDGFLSFFFARGVGKRKAKRMAITF